MTDVFITFGASNTHSYPAANYATLGALLNCPIVKHEAGHDPSAVEATVNGVSANDDYALRPGDKVNLTSRANKKG